MVTGSQQLDSYPILIKPNKSGKAVFEKIAWTLMWPFYPNCHAFGNR